MTTISFIALAYFVSLFQKKSQAQKTQFTFVNKMQFRNLNNDKIPLQKNYYDTTTQQKSYKPLVQNFKINEFDLKKTQNQNFQKNGNI